MFRSAIEIFLKFFSSREFIAARSVSGTQAGKVRPVASSTHSRRGGRPHRRVAETARLGLVALKQHVRDLRGRAVAVEVAREQAVAAAHPRGALGEIVVVEVEVGVVVVATRQLEAVAVGGQYQRVGAGNASAEAGLEREIGCTCSRRRTAAFWSLPGVSSLNQRSTEGNRRTVVVFLGSWYILLTGKGRLPADGLVVQALRNARRVEEIALGPKKAVLVFTHSPDRLHRVLIRVHRNAAACANGNR